MPTDLFTSINDLDFIFENKLVKIVANRDMPEIELAGLKVGPFQKGNEYRVMFWIAQELTNSGSARFREEELLDLMKLNKLHWKERVQSAKRIADLPEDFYPRIRRYLFDLKRIMVKETERIKEYEKALSLSRDIINLRLKKLVSLASAPKQTDQVLQNLTKEERELYTILHETISDWRTAILNVDGGATS